VEEKVVGRRRAVLAKQAWNLARRVRGDSYRDPLVDPERRVERARSQEQGQAEQDEERRGDND